jgi:hypothetical protein
MMRRFATTAFAMFLLACSPALAKSPKPDHVETYLADVVIRTDGAQVMVLLDTILDAGTPPDGEIDQWFTLQTAEPVLTPVTAYLERALVVHTSRALRVTTSDQRYELVIEPSGMPELVLATRVVGIGLSHNRGSKGPKIKDQLDRKGQVVPACDWCVFEQDPGTGGSGGAACRSGGPGSTSCSATRGTDSCSVTCANGYYACCNALPGAASCRCVKG